MIIPHVGGGFGGKAGIHLEPLLACLSRKAGGRPVKLQATREEEFSLLPCRSALTYRIKTGVASDGKITAQQMTMYWDAGAYADYAVNVTRASGYSAAGPYEIPNAWLDAYTIYTNKPYGTAYRGFGHVEFFWGLERHMELVAERDRHGSARVPAEEPAAAGLHDADRRDDHRAHRRPAQVPRRGGRGHRLRHADRRGGGARAAYRPEDRQGRRHAAQGAGHAVVHRHRRRHQDELRRHGARQPVAHRDRPGLGHGARADRGRDGCGFPIEKVKVTVEKDTDRDPYDWQTVASKGLILSGNAVVLACDDLLKHAYADAAQVLRAHVDRPRPRRARRSSSSTARTSRSRSPQLSVGYAYPNGNAIGGPLVGVGRYVAQGLSNLDKETGQGLPALDWTYGAHGVVVDVDPDTGEFDVLKIASAFDVGKVINPGLVRGQCIGGMIQGLGTALCEGYIYDEQGRSAEPVVHRQQDPDRQGHPGSHREHGGGDAAARRAVRRPGCRRAPDDLGGAGDRQCDPPGHRRRVAAHAHPGRGRVAGDAATRSRSTTGSPRRRPVTAARCGCPESRSWRPDRTTQNSWRSAPLSADRPAGVSRTARPEPMRSSQCVSKKRWQIAAPDVPARCGRRSVQSRQRRANGRRAPACLLDVDAEVGEPGQAIRRDRPALGVEQAALDHRVGDADSERARQVVVARAGTSERPAGGGRPQRSGRRRMRRPGRQVLDQFGHLRVGQADVTVPPLVLLGDQADGGEAVEVLARGRAGHVGVPGQFARRPRPAVEQGQAERRPGAVGERSGKGRQLRRAVIGGIHVINYAGQIVRPRPN